MNDLRACVIIAILLLFSFGCDLTFQQTNTLILDEKATQLTSESGIKDNPAWSPDGSLIAYSYEGIATNVTAKSLTDETSETLGRVEEDITGLKFDISPDGRKLVYYSTRRGQLLVADLASGSEFVLTQLSAARGPAWSPNGQQIAFTAFEPNSNNINVWIIPAVGGDPQKITDTAGRDRLPTWSPDSKKIAYESIQDTLKQIWISDIATGESVQLTPASTRAEAPDWSPDGSVIAYSADSNGRVDIWTIPAGGGPETQLTRNVDAFNPSWSPDGSKIAYRTSAGVWVSSSNGDVLHRTDIREIYPAWQSGGQAIIESIRTGFSQIRLFSLDDSRIIPLTEQKDDQFDSEPEWFPDSRNIIFTRRNLSELSGQTLWTQSILGGPARPLLGDANRNGFEFSPSISPDGNWLVFDDRNRIFLVQLSDGAIVDLSPYIGNGLRQADWGPDSQSIVCNNFGTLKIFSTDSTLVVQERNLPGRFDSPVWSMPHPVFGSHIAATGSSGIFVMQPDGSDVGSVISGGRSPSWSPDGNTLAFIRQNQLFIMSIFTEFD